MDLEEETSAYVHYVVPRELESRMPEFFKKLRASREALKVHDVQLGLCTLEDVFLNIARLAELEEAKKDGKTTKIEFEGTVMCSCDASYLRLSRASIFRSARRPCSTPTTSSSPSSGARTRTGTSLLSTFKRR